MIQDIFPHVLHNQYDPSRQASSRSIVLAFREGDVLIRGGSFPRVKDLAGISENDLIYLFSIDDDKDYFLLPGEAEAPEGFEYVNLRAFRDRYIDIDTENCTAALADFIERLI